MKYALAKALVLMGSRRKNPERDQDQDQDQDLENGRYSLSPKLPSWTKSGRGQASASELGGSDAGAADSLVLARDELKG